MVSNLCFDCQKFPFHSAIDIPSIKIMTSHFFCRNWQHVSSIKIMTSHIFFCRNWQTCVKSLLGYCGVLISLQEKCQICRRPNICRRLFVGAVDIKAGTRGSNNNRRHMSGHQQTRPTPMVLLVRPSAYI